jgi:hypothetical protein
MMDIVVSKLYEEQLKEILELLLKDDFKATKHFKMYLDTIILNIQSKEKKYKKSIYFDNENIKDIEFQGCKIPFFIDNEKKNYFLLGITAKN